MLPGSLGSIALSAALVAAPHQSATTSPAIAVAPMAPCIQRGAAFGGAECGAIRVFENRRTKQGRTIDIAFARWRAQTQPATSAVFLLAGGPGAPGTSLAFDADGWMAPLRSTMDLVVIDQRGTWYSHALHCARDSDERPATAFGHVFDPSWVRACRALLERTADLKQYSTEFAAEDLDDVRATLGYGRVALYGGSYGTRLAQAYMRRYPERTRAVVLDGVLPFDNRAPLMYAAGAQQALDRVIDDCAARPMCRGTYPKLRADFARLLDLYRDGPIATAVTDGAGATVPVRMSRGDFGYAVRGILYRADQVNQLAALINRAAASGNVSEFAQRYWERHVSFSRTFSNGLHLSILCAEDIAFVTDAEIEAATAGTFLGRYLIDEYRRACALWPVQPAPAEARRPVANAVPTLLLSGYYDPVTPSSFADRVAQTLPASLRLLSRFDGHGSAPRCADAARFVLQRATVTGAPDSCR